MIRVIIADDHKILVDGLKAFLDIESDIDVVAVALNGEEVIDLLGKNLEIDVVVLDIEMPQMDGIVTTQQIKKQFPETKVVILSMYKKKEFILQLFQLGVNGYILKNRGKEELVAAIHTVYRDAPYFPLDIMKIITENPFLKKRIEPKLTSRELEILCLVAQAHSAKEIGGALNIERVTVEAHIRNIKGKLNLKRSGELIRYALKNEICE